MMNLISYGLFVKSLATQPARPVVAQAAAAELLTLGYLVDMEALKDLGEDDLTSMVHAARANAHADNVPQPLYPNFPKSVRESSRLKLIIEQLIHYASHGTIKDYEAKVPRVNMTVGEMISGSKPLEIIDKHQAVHKLASIVKGSIAMSDQDLVVVDEIISLVEIDVTQIISEISNNENYALFARICVKNYGIDVAKVFIQSARNADALLGAILAAYTTITLDQLRMFNAKGVTFNTIPREHRRTITRALVNLAPADKLDEFVADRVVARKSTWRKVLRKVHPYEFSTQDRAVLDIIHGNCEYMTLNATYENLLSQHKFVEAAEFLAVHAPGKLVRSAVLLTSSSADKGNKVVKCIESIAAKVKVTTLISAINGVRLAAHNIDQVRVIKGSISEVISRDIRLTDLQAEKLESALYSGILARLRNANLKVTESIDVGDSDTPVKLVNRTASYTDRTLSAGDVVPLGNDLPIARLFTHWFDTDIGRNVDLDLGVCLCDKSGEVIDSYSYDNYTWGRRDVTYSGDLICAPRPEGAAEYFDVDLARLPGDVRYVALTVNSYSGQSLKSIDQFSGIMLRDGMGDSGEIFEPRTVRAGATLTQNGRFALPLLLDVERREMIWVDQVISAGWAHSVTDRGYQVEAIVKDIVTPYRFTVHELLQALATAQKTLVNELEPFNTDLVSEILAC